MAQVLEIMMLLAFGFSWPQNIRTTLKNKSTKGKSLAFLVLIDLGYICGIAAKLVAGSIVWYVLFFYCLNFCMVATDICLYFYYRSKENATNH